MTISEIGLRTIAFCAGTLLFYSIFLYEDENTRVQSSLEDWWIRLEDQKQAALNRQTVFVREIARSIDHFLDGLLGRNLLSVRAVSISVCYSLSTASATALLLFPFSTPYGAELLALPLSTLSDLYVLLLARRTFKEVINAVSAAQILQLLMLNLLALGLVILVPYFLSLTIQLPFLIKLAFMNVWSGLLLEIESTDDACRTFLWLKRVTILTSMEPHQPTSRVGAMAARNQPDQGHPAVVTRLGEGRAAGIPWVGAPLTLRLPYYARRTPAGRN